MIRLRELVLRGSLGPWRPRFGPRTARLSDVALALSSGAKGLRSCVERAGRPDPARVSLRGTEWPTRAAARAPASALRRIP